MNRKLGMAGAAIVLAGLILFGCKAAPAPSVGFADPKEMKPDPTVPFNRFWREPNVDWKQYENVYIAPVNTAYMLKMTDWQKGDRKETIQKDVATLADYSRTSMMKAFRDDPNHRYTVVDSPTTRPHTLVYEVALIEVVPSKVLLNALGYAPFFIGTGISLVRDIGNDKSSAAFEARVRDGATGRIVMLAADREAEQFAIVDTRGLTWYSDAEGIMDQWSKEFVAVAEKKPGERIEGISTFRLLPW
jgi:hypothetical protein